jgi:hypothetical protein
MVVQAGQPVVTHDGRQVVAMTRARLASALAQLKHDAAGDVVEVRLEGWNGYPVDIHPASGVLHELGFRFSGRELRWPPPAVPARTEPSSERPEEFRPFDRDPPPAQFGPDWVVSRAPQNLRPVLGGLLEVLQEVLSGEEWKWDWQFDGHYQAFYRGRGCLRVVVRKRYVDCTLHPGVPGGGRASHARRRLRRPADVDAAFAAELRRLRDRAEEVVDAYLERIGKDG